MAFVRTKIGTGLVLVLAFGADAVRAQNAQPFVGAGAPTGGVPTVGSFGDIGSFDRNRLQPTQGLGIAAQALKTPVTAGACLGKLGLTPTGGGLTYVPRSGKSEACSTFAPDSGKALAECPADATQLKKSASEKNDKAREALECRKKSFDELLEKVGCVAQVGSALSEQANGARELASKVLDGATSDIEAAKQYEGARQQQLNDVGQRLSAMSEALSGGKDAKEGSGFAAMVRALPNEEAAVTNALREVVRARRSFEEIKEQRAFDWMNRCMFDGAQFPYKECEPNSGKLVSRADYAACRVKQQAQVVGGRVENQDQALERVGNKLAGQLRALLTEVRAFGSSGVSGAEAMGAAPRGGPTASFAAFERQFKSRFEAFDRSTGGSKGFGVETYQLLTRCYEDVAKDRVARELSSRTPNGDLSKGENTILGAQLLAIENNEQTTLRRYQGFLETGARAYREAMEALTGEPTDYKRLDACSSQTQFGSSQTAQAGVDAKLRCVAEMRRDLTGLLDGTTPESVVVFNIAGQQAGTSGQSGAQADSVKPISLSCNGVLKCQSELRRLARSLEADVARTKQRREGHASQLVRQLTNEVSVYRKTAQASDRALTSVRNRLNSELAAIGIKHGLEVSAYPDKKLALNKDGLPENIDDVIAQMRAGLGDYTGEKAAQSRNKIAESGTEVFEKLQKQIDDAETALTQKLAQCAKERKRAATEEVGSLKTKLNSFGQVCESDQVRCPEFFAGDVAALFDSVGAIARRVGATGMAEVNAEYEKLRRFCAEGRGAPPASNCSEAELKKMLENAKSALDDGSPRTGSAATPQ